MKAKTGLLMLTLLSFLFFASIVNASLIVKPGKQGRMVLQLYPFIPATFSRKIEIGNSYDFNITIKLKPSENFTDMMELSEEEFVLQPNERKNVTYTVTVKEPGVYDGGIIVLPSGENVSSNYAFQSDLTVVAFKKSMVLETYLAIILLAILFPIGFFIYKKKRSKR